MANVLHRVTKQYRKSVNTPDFPVGVWIINPDVSAVQGFANKYWVITGDVVTLMNQISRDAIDTAEESARRDSIADELDQSQTIMRAFAEVVLDEINDLRGQHGLGTRTLAQLKVDVRNKL